MKPIKKAVVIIINALTEKSIYFYYPRYIYEYIWVIIVGLMISIWVRLYGNMAVNQVEKDVLFLGVFMVLILSFLLFRIMTEEKIVGFKLAEILGFVGGLYVSQWLIRFSVVIMVFTIIMLIIRDFEEKRIKKMGWMQ
jgi:hypothetical protein